MDWEKIDKMIDVQMFGHHLNLFYWCFIFTGATVYQTFVLYQKQGRQFDGLKCNFTFTENLQGDLTLDPQSIPFV